MRNGFSRIGWTNSALVIAGVVCLFGNATQAQAQWGYAPPYGYAVPTAPVYGYGYGYQQAAYYAPPMAGYVSPIGYAAPVVAQPYVAYSNPGIYAPAPAAIHDRVHYGAFGGRVENYNTWGPGYSHLHVHTRDGLFGHHDRVRYHY
jgi:hypothetical protein